MRIDPISASIIHEYPMPAIDRLTDLGEKFPSTDRMEAYVRYCLVQNPGIFRNHFSENLPQMVATIPGQYNTQCGIDVLAVDGNRPRRRLWLIEISRGRERGAALEKELPNRLYAGNRAQMSLEWRRAAANRFLRRADSSEKLQALFDLSGLKRAALEELFENYFDSHQAAVVVPSGCHVAGNETGLGFATDIYTFNWLFANRRTGW
jgi:hypothetical protein